MHWAAQQGRRDIVEFIRRLVAAHPELKPSHLLAVLRSYRPAELAFGDPAQEGGHGLLASRDDQGAEPHMVHEVRF